MLEKIKDSIKGYRPKIYGSPKKSAVLLPLIDVNDEWHILYEVRSKAVSQAGDSSFPGGRLENGESFEEAAVRETMEELNLSRENIKVIGEIDYIASQHLIIHCFVGVIEGVQVEDIQPNVEVEKLYTIPVNYFLENSPSYFEVGFDVILDDQFIKDLEKHHKQYELSNSVERIPHYEIEEHSLWGYTANLTERFINIIRNDLKK